MTDQIDEPQAGALHHLARCGPGPTRARALTSPAAGGPCRSEWTCLHHWLGNRDARCDMTELTGPEVVVFDVNETLSDLEPLRNRLTEGGAPGHLLETWFAATLRDGFALTVVGDCAPFKTVGNEVLHGLLSSQQGLPGDPRELAEHVLDGFTGLGLHPHVAEGLRVLHGSGRRLVTLTNGSTTVSEALLEAAGVTGLIERQLSVEDAGRWKPHPDAYAWAAAQCGTTPSAMLMVAVHPWDLHGAAHAGMTTGWLNRKGAPYPEVFARPTWQAPDLLRLAEQVVTAAAAPPRSSGGGNR